MKKLLSIILLGAVLVLSGCSSKKETDVDYSKLELAISGMASLKGFSDLDHIEDFSDLIVTGIFIDDSHNAEELGIYNGLSDITSCNTMRISKVIKGDANIGDEIEIRQYYSVEDGKLFTISVMTPMIKGDSWLFFLEKASGDNGDHYFCVGDYQGRYPIPGTDNTVLPYALDNGTYDPGDFRDDIYSEILEKYKF